VCVDSFGWVTESVSGIKEWRVKMCRYGVCVCRLLWMGNGKCEWHKGVEGKNVQVWGLCVSTPLDG
jgi:hypothetical protein